MRAWSGVDARYARVEREQQANKTTQEAHLCCDCILRLPVISAGLMDHRSDRFKDGCACILGARSLARNLVATPSWVRCGLVATAVCCSVVTRVIFEDHSEAQVRHSEEQTRSPERYIDIVETATNL